MKFTAGKLKEKSPDKSKEDQFGMVEFVAGHYQAISPPRSTFDNLNSSGKLQLKKPLSDFIRRLSKKGITFNELQINLK